MIIYMHPNGQGDFRVPAKVSVGLFHYRMPDGRIVFDPLISIENIPRVYRYQQPQITYNPR